MKIFKNKKFITYISILLVAVFCLLFLSGCNKQIIDLEYNYDKVVCYYGAEKIELAIDSWQDYDGEQLQIKSNGKTYLLTANNCYMVNE